MKFEHVLQIYWAKGILTNGKLLSFEVGYKSFFSTPGGYGQPSKDLFMKRFELYQLLKKPNLPLSNFGPAFAEAINRIFARITSVNYSVHDLTRLNLLRLYLIKTTRGRSHALGKPSRGQRTWSNAWSAYNVNTITRKFIGEYQKTMRSQAKEEKINYRLIKKKSARKKKKDVASKIVVKVNNWF
jgi:hypothetical protein